MAEARELIFFVGGSDTTYDNTYSWMSEMVPGVKNLSSIVFDALFGILGHLAGVYDDFLTLVFTLFQSKRTWWIICLVEIFSHIS